MADHSTTTTAIDDKELQFLIAPNFHIHTKKINAPVLSLEFYLKKIRNNLILKSKKRRFSDMLKQKPNPNEDDDEDTDDDSEELGFFTYDTAPRVNRTIILWNVYQQWSKCLPGGGVERLLCIIMAIFLVLMVASIQFWLRMDWNTDWLRASRKSNSWIRRYFCDPSIREEKISFDCYILLLIVGWLGSIFISILTMALHFICWWWRYCRNSQKLANEPNWLQQPQLQRNFD